MKKECVTHQSSKKISHNPKFKGNFTDMEGYILDCSDYKKANKYVKTTKRIAEYVGVDQKKGGDTMSTIKNKERYSIPRPTYPITTSTTTSN